MSYTKKEKKQLQAEAIEHLTATLAEIREKTGKTPTVYTQVINVARSGMSRDVRVYVVAPDLDIVNITWYTGHAIGQIPRDNRFGDRVIKMGGCGYNAGLEVASNLTYALYGYGAKLQQKGWKAEEGVSLRWEEL